MSSSEKTIHASCVAIDGRGVLICGESGSGKTRLLIELVRRGAKFLADDAVSVAERDGSFVGTCPEGNRGLIGVSAFSVAELDTVIRDADRVDACPIEVCVDLDGGKERRAEGPFGSIPTIYLERAEPSVMAEICESRIRALLPVTTRC
ncbi:MAG: HPr kinase/phosphatase C-terminal domain-containing protein [Acidobacteria bacterium]|nr:HPr kinase/phosphatase C-terminal domain-containing protein [Acidobacteriota bacterium]